MSVVKLSLLRWLRLISVWHAIEQPKAIVAVALVFTYDTGLIVRRDTGVFVAPRPLAWPLDSAATAELRAQIEAQSLNLMTSEELVQMFLGSLPLRDFNRTKPTPPFESLPWDRARSRKPLLSPFGLAAPISCLSTSEMLLHPPPLSLFIFSRSNLEKLGTRFHESFSLSLGVAGVCAGFERQNLVPAFPIAPPLRQIADTGEGYVSLFPMCFLGRPAFYLTDTFLADTKFTSKLTQCRPSATANENGSFPFCEFAQIWGDCGPSPHRPLRHTQGRSGTLIDRTPWRRGSA